MHREVNAVTLTYMANTLTFVFPFGSQPSQEVMAGRFETLVVDVTLDGSGPQSINHNMNAAVDPEVLVQPRGGADQAVPGISFPDPNTVTLTPSVSGGSVRVYIKRLA